MRSMCTYQQDHIDTTEMATTAYEQLSAVRATVGCHFRQAG